MVDRPLTMMERAQFALARRLLRLPGPAQVALSGSLPIRRDGLTLHPELQLLLALRRRTGGRSLMHGTPAEARRRLRRESLVFAGEPRAVGEVRNLVIEAPRRPMMARLYLPEGISAPPLLVFFHGGGFVIGDLDTHDAPCRLLCAEGRMAVLSVEYALAPEAPFPAAIEDGQAALGWARENAAALAVDGARVAVGGDSAGGTLACALSLLAARGEGPMPAAQLLLYPALDRTSDWPSMSLFADRFFLTRADVENFAAHYSAGADGADPRLHPLRAERFDGLPPTLVVTAGFDPLRDEGEAFVARLQEAGVAVTHRRYERLIHGFANMTTVSPVCADAMSELTGLFARMLQASDGTAQGGGPGTAADGSTNAGDAPPLPRVEHG